MNVLGNVKSAAQSKTYLVLNAANACLWTARKDGKQRVQPRANLKAHAVAAFSQVKNTETYVIKSAHAYTHTDEIISKINF